MKTRRNWKTLGGCVLVPALVAGCGGVSSQDVADARSEVAEEQRETDEARQRAAAAVREEQRETDEARHEAMKPVVDEDDLANIREEKQETQEARDAGLENIREEQQETREAAEKARQAEATFKAQKARDTYVSEVEVKLEAADKRIEHLETQGEKLEGPAKVENGRQIQELQTRRDRVQDALDELKSEEILEWRRSHAEVERAVKDLAEELEESR